MLQNKLFLIVITIVVLIVKGSPQQDICGLKTVESFRP